MKFLVLALEEEKGSFDPFIINIDKIAFAFNDELGGEWCLKLILEDGSDFYCTHLLNKKGNFVDISGMISFYRYIEGL